jgi:hypothetical protein
MNMNTELRVVLTQIMGLVVLLLGNFGMDLSAEDKLTLINGLTALGLAISSLVAYWPTLKAALFPKPPTEPDDGEGA